ncbi:MAG TPA: multidrug effflux MFS transporter [Steroidobacteraceae bacterium]|nr:multidrug effflux MFS transporter [Steroidobacteraceae bacterium]
MTRPALSERALLGLLAAVTAAGPVALNIYLPVLPLVQAEFGVSVASASTTVSAPLIAFAIGLLTWGPLSDHLGRRPVILAGLGVNVAGSALALLSPSIGWLTLGRVIQAIGSSAGVTVARATIADLFDRERMARMIAYLTMIMLLANSLAPAAGGALAAAAGWRSVFVFLGVAAVPIWWATWAFLPETRSAGHGRSLREVLQASIALLGGAIYAEFFVFVALMPYVFKGALGHSTTEYGLWYLCIAVGYFAGNWYVVRYAATTGIHRLLTAGIVISALFAVAGWALAVAAMWQPVWLFAPWVFIAFGQGLSFPGLTASAVALAPRSAGAAAGLLGFVQQILGALCVQAMSVSSTATPVPVTAFCALTGLAAWLGLRAGAAVFGAAAGPRPR